MTSFFRHLLQPEVDGAADDSTDDRFYIYDYLNHHYQDQDNRMDKPVVLLNKRLTKRAYAYENRAIPASKRAYAYENRAIPASKRAYALEKTAVSSSKRALSYNKMAVPSSDNVFQSINKRLPGECFNSCVAGGMKEYQCRGICLR